MLVDIKDYDKSRLKWVSIFTVPPVYVVIRSSSFSAVMIQLNILDKK